MIEIRHDVKEALALRNMTLKDLAIEIDITYDRLSHLVNGIRAPRYEEEEKIRKFLMSGKAVGDG